MVSFLIMFRFSLVMIELRIDFMLLIIIIVNMVMIMFCFISGEIWMMGVVSMLVNVVSVMLKL